MFLTPSWISTFEELYHWPPGYPIPLKMGYKVGRKFDDMRNPIFKWDWIDPNDHLHLEGKIFCLEKPKAISKRTFPFASKNVWKRMGEYIGLSIFCIIFGFLVICIHMIGAWFLIKTNTTIEIRENIELFSLSISSSLAYAYTIFRTASGMQKNSGGFEIRDLLKPLPGRFGHAPSCLIIGLIIPEFASMIALPLQRFFAIYYHLRYETSKVYVNRTRVSSVFARFLINRKLY